MHRSESLRLVVPALLVLLAGSGCSRKFFREAADKDVAGVITQKNIFPAWQVKNWHVYPDPRARFADPYNPDRPPYPPDDFAARSLSPNPQHPTKKTGVGRLDGDGYLQLLANWDIENRSAEEVPARGAPPERLFMPRPAYAPPTNPPRPAAAAATPVPPSSPVPAKPEVFEPVFTSATANPTPTFEASPWVASRPRIELKGSDPAPTAAVGPRITEVRSPAIITIGETEENGQPVPAIAVVPMTQPPTTLPDLQQPAPKSEPIPAPKQPGVSKTDLPGPKDPKDPGVAPDIQTLIATGDVAANYLRALSSNQQGYRIKLQQAVELGLINSREFQDRREDLYIAALPVTLQRFSFAAQAFANEQVVRQSFGQELPNAGQFWRADTATGLNKLFPTGATMLVQLANQVVINLGSSKPTLAISDFTLSLAQPFLRGGGFAVTLESLTQVERNMVYAIRSYARFRKLFYVATVGGPTGGLGLTNNPYGLQGLSVNLGRGVGSNLTSPVVGYLPLLQQAAVIANQRKNVEALEGLLRQYEAFREAGQIAPLQVGQVERDLLTSRSLLLGQGGGGGGGGGIRGYLDSLDNFKLQLGLPLTVGLDLDATPLKPIRDQLDRFEDVYGDLRQLEADARKFDPAVAADQYRVRWRKLLTESELVKGTAFAKGIGARWDAWAKLTQQELTTREAELVKLRSALLDQRIDRRVKNIPEPPAETARIAALEAELELAGFERATRAFEAKPWQNLKEPEASGVRSSAFQRMFTAFFQVLLGASNERLTATRKEWPKLPPLVVNDVDLLTTDLDEAYTAVIQTALSYRLDLMNARGQVVDAYRQIAVQANSLQGVLDVQYDLNVGTPTNVSIPFGFTGDRTASQLTIRGELPLVRRAERNNYRASLIGYQRQRRTLMAFEDNIANDVRNDIRELRTLAELYKIQQRLVELGYSQVDNARETQFAPLAAGVSSDPGSSAALTQQLLQAQNNLLSAQNTLYGLWVSYQTARMNLYLDLELMQIDERGVWTDEQVPGIDNTPRDLPADRTRERLPAPQPVGPADRK